MNERKAPAARIRSDAEFYAAVREKYQYMHTKELKRRARIRSAVLLLVVCLLPLTLLSLPQSGETPSDLPLYSAENGLPEPIVTNGLYLTYGLFSVELDDGALVEDLYATLQAFGESAEKEENHIQTIEVAETRPAESDHPVDQVTKDDAEAMIPEDALVPDENEDGQIQDEYTLTFTRNGEAEIYVLSQKCLYRVENQRRVLVTLLSDAEFSALTARLAALIAKG